MYADAVVDRDLVVDVMMAVAERTSGQPLGVQQRRDAVASGARV
jgi:hypothetical protein